MVNEKTLEENMIASRKNAALEMRRDNSRNFISDYLMDLKLREVSATEDAEAYDTSRDKILTPPRPFNGDLREGQIRLLSQPSELTYAVLLRRWGEDAFVVAPFSRFPSPATDEELKTVFDGGLYLRVIQVWNIRTALDATLRKSWLVGELPQQDIEDAWKVWEWTLGGAELAESILRRTGLPVSLKSDPRNQYMHEELEKFAAFDAEDEANAEKAEADMERLHFVITFPKYGRMEDKLAAGDKPSETIEIFLVAEYGIEIEMKHAPDEGKVRIVVYGADGRRDHNSLEGVVVVDKNGIEVGKIENGVLLAESMALAKGFALLHPETRRQISIDPKDR